MEQCPADQRDEIANGMGAWITALDDDLTLKPTFNVTGTLSILTVSILTIPTNVSSFFTECPIIS
jgi:hypothetical protein